MFQSNAENNRLVDIVYDLFEKMDRGQVLPWQDIEDAIKITRHTGSFDHICNRARTRLRRRREIVTYCDVGKGVRLLAHKEAAVLVPQNRMKRVKRQCTRGINELRCVSDSALSDHQRRQKSAQLRKLMETRREAKKQLKQQSLITATETVPRRKVAEAAT